jgi:hypothetical protein
MPRYAKTLSQIAGELRSASNASRNWARFVWEGAVRRRQACFWQMAGLGCSSSGGSSLAPAPGGRGVAKNPSCGVATLPANNLLFNLAPGLTVDSTGIAFVTLSNAETDGGATGFVWSSTFSGSVSLLFTLPGSAFPGPIASDGNSVYIATTGFGSSAVRAPPPRVSLLMPEYAG